MPRVMLLLLVFAAALLASQRTFASSEPAACDDAGVCGLADPALTARESPPVALSPSASVRLLFFWGVGCPHCEDAKPFVDELSREEPRLGVQAVEVRRDPEGRRRFIETMDRLGVSASGVPTFVVGDAYVVGFTRGDTEKQVRAMVASAMQRPNGPAPVHRTVRLPWFGSVDPSAVPLPMLTVAMGLADGINPCAIWVLVVLLGILLHVETTKRMLLYAGTFVVMSGVVYFLFMTAWSAVFSLVGLSRVFTMILGGALVAMAALNLKDVVWFKRGPSLVISDKVKPGLFRRMRAIAAAASMPVALGGIAVLAFVVNLVELGCTVGLPAIYTRILSLRPMAAAERFAFLALYNMVYVVPLMLVVAAFIGLKRRLTVGERTARALKGVSGVLLAVFGALFLFAPDTIASM